MFHTLLINLAILALIAYGIATEGNPLYAILVLALQELPHGLVQQKMQLDAMRSMPQNDDDDDAQPIGFTADVKSK